MSSELARLMNNYRPLGLMEGTSNFVLKPDLALHLADDLDKIGVPITAVELWYWVEFEGKQYLTEDPYGPSFDQFFDQPDAVSKTVEAAKHYLTHDLPERIVYVSYVLHTDEHYWEMWDRDSNEVAKAG